MIAIYARQSVDRPDSISIESQIEFCRQEARNCSFKIYQDRGYSGKNTDRPQFQEMMKAVEDGEISRVIVYKLDRISRSILDFSNMIETFGKYQVEFVSCSEKFDTSTPMGRAMLHICIVFAQLERETIQKRVADAYHSRSRKGFFMGGCTPYGFDRQKTTINGIETSRYVPENREARAVQMMYDLYARAECSLGDIVRQLERDGIKNRRQKGWERSRISEILRNPVYVQANWQVYEYFRQKGVLSADDIGRFNGIHGCYLYRIPDGEEFLVLAPHEGLIDADTWLNCQEKLDSHTQIRSNGKMNTWLAGKIKCARCGYALTIRKSQSGRYFECSRHMNNRECKGAGTIYANEIEEAISREIERRLREIGSISKTNNEKDPTNCANLRSRLNRLEEQQRLLLEKLPQANDQVMEYINRTVMRYKQEKTEVITALKKLERQHSGSAIQGCDILWRELPQQQKREVLDILVEEIRACQGELWIRWRV